MTIQPVSVWTREDSEFCGCCGRPIGHPALRLWCQDCESHTDLSVGLRVWQRTYEAQHGVPCPFQVG